MLKRTKKNKNNPIIFLSFPMTPTLARGMGERIASSLYRLPFGSRIFGLGVWGLKLPTGQI